MKILDMSARRNENDEIVLTFRAGRITHKFVKLWGRIPKLRTERDRDCLTMRFDMEQKAAVLAIYNTLALGK